MILRAPTQDECRLVGEWRSEPDVLAMLRTGAKTQAEQDTFYRDVVSNPQSEHRYYALDVDGQFVGLGGLTYLRHPETSPLAHQITLVIGAPFRRQGYGMAAVSLLVTQACVWLQLAFVQGECFATGPVGFWRTCFSQIGVPGRQWTEPDGTYRWRWDLRVLA